MKITRPEVFETRRPSDTDAAEEPSVPPIARRPIGFVSQPDAPWLDRLNLGLDLLPIVIVVIVLINLALVSFRDAGSTLIGLGVLLLSLGSSLIGNEPVYNADGTPALPRRTLVYLPTGLFVLVVGVIASAVVPQPKAIAIVPPVRTTTTPAHVVVKLPCDAIVTRIVPVDSALQGFTTSSRCAGSQAAPVVQAVESSNTGFMVKQMELAFRGSPSSIRVELRDVPRGAFYEAQFAESVTHQPFDRTESVVWEIKDSNRVAFSLISPALAHFRAAWPGGADFLLNLRNLGWPLAIAVVALILARWLLGRLIGDATRRFVLRLVGIRAPKESE